MVSLSPMANLPRKCPDFLYQDDRISIDDSGITVRDYYFPLGGRKFVPWVSIRAARELRLGFWTGKYRLWGMGVTPVWFNLDPIRARREQAFVLDTGGVIQTALTPENSGKVREIL